MDFTAEDVSKLMKEASDDCGVIPQDLTGKDFRKFLTVKGVELPAAELTKLGGFANIRDSAFPPAASEVSEAREAVREKAKANRAIAKADTIDSKWFKRFEEVGEKVFAGKVYPSPNSLKADKTKTKRYLNLVLSDLHFGAMLGEETVPFPYGRIEESRRLAHVVDQVSRYKLDYRKDTSLNVFLLGDIIENQLHDPRAGAPLAEQTCTAIWLLTQAVSYLAANFKSVTVYCTTGNHGRNAARHPGRAMDGKWDSIETGIYYSVKIACNNLKNVTFEIPKAPWISFEQFGMRGYATHGDTHLNPGNPGKSIEVGRITNIANSLNAGLPDDEEYKVFVCGHVHAASVSWLNNGSTLITNGALTPPNEYAVAIGYVEANNCQMMWETVPGHMVGDVRAISVGPEVDKDASLDKIIAPFDGF